MDPALGLFPLAIERTLHKTPVHGNNFWRFPWSILARNSNARRQGCLKHGKQSLKTKGQRLLEAMPSSIGEASRSHWNGSPQIYRWQVAGIGVLPFAYRFTVDRHALQARDDRVWGKARDDGIGVEVR
jgi:hypothetical protein